MAPCQTPPHKQQQPSAQLAFAGHGVCDRVGRRRIKRSILTTRPFVLALLLALAAFAGLLAGCSASTQSRQHQPSIWPTAPDGAAPDSYSLALASFRGGPAAIKVTVKDPEGNPPEHSVITLWWPQARLPDPRSARVPRRPTALSSAGEGAGRVPCEGVIGVINCAWLVVSTGSRMAGPPIFGSWYGGGR